MARKIGGAKHVFVNNGRRRINISVTLVSESYVILYCERNVICNSSIKNV
jgi:hypothetical protein